ncbi:MAG: endonuclease/exonuclease/phosphatase family protein [Planctomycetota bacterium]
MRLLTYNILDGGVGRADPLAEVMLANDPDVVALIEAEDDEQVRRIATRLSMDVVPAPGRSRQCVLLSRLPVTSSVNHGLASDGPRSCVECEVNGLPIAVVHLHPHRPRHDEDQRLREIGFVLGKLERHRVAGRPHVIMGDFNSVSPLQHVEESKLRPGDLHGLRENENTFPRDVVQTMLDSYYVDVFAELNPKTVANAGTLDTIHAGLRVDYVFAWGFPPEALLDAKIETDRLAKYASDHYPVVAELKWP